MIEETIGDTPKPPAPTVKVTRDANGDYRFRICGVNAHDDANERYLIEIIGQSRKD